ncbi:MAG: ATP-binding protein, partial [Candidatus Neomarinimicrobiota bacterium]
GIGQKSMTFVNVDMKNMVRAMYYEKTTAAERKRIEFTINDMPHVAADTTMMRLVWMNLISNAVKFSSKRRKSIISVSGKAEKNKLTYCIKDNGTGFKMKYADKLFSLFERLHLEREYEGHGAGLALVHRIIQRHKGNIWAEGEIDKGAIFYFSLPNKVK